MAQQPQGPGGDTKQLPSKVQRLNKAPVNNEILKVKLPHPTEVDAAQWPDDPGAGTAPSAHRLLQTCGSSPVRSLIPKTRRAWHPSPQTCCATARPNAIARRLQPNWTNWRATFNADAALWLKPHHHHSFGLEPVCRQADGGDERHGAQSQLPGRRTAEIPTAGGRAPLPAAHQPWIPGAGTLCARGLWRLSRGRAVANAWIH